MADYNLAWAKTTVREGRGKYSNRPADRGGETYWGVSRVKQSNWPGWVLIDEAKLRIGFNFPADLITIEKLTEMVQTFYFMKYWKPFADLTNQRLAEALFDTAVNSGLGQTIRFIQRTLNLLDGKPVDALAVDGGFGPQTRLALQQADANPKESRALLFGVKVLRAALCFNLAEEHPDQEANMHGWIYRIDAL